jgi:hypothetical membrane protein
MNQSNELEGEREGAHVRRARSAGIVWIGAIQFFLAQIVVQSRWTTPFSLANNFISDLGNTACGAYGASGAYVCSPWHAVMNASFAAQGVIIGVGAWLARSVMPRAWTSAVIGLLLAMTAVGMLGVGAFPENVNNRAHVLSAGTQFITGNAAMVVFGSAARKVARWGVFSWISVCLGVVGLIATVIFAHGYGLGLGVGGLERVAAYTLPVWLIAAGVLLVRQSVTSAPPR